MTRFSAILMDHFQSPRNRGRLTDAHAVGLGTLGGGPPRVTIYLRKHADHVEAAMFEAEGCGVTIGCASRLTELVAGRSLDDCSRLRPEDLITELEGLPADKHYCAWVAVEALNAALNALVSVPRSD